jgi:hypothetical protein
MKNYKQKEIGIKYGFRSGLEEKVGQQLENLGITVEYEAQKIKYIEPAKNRTYTPDFVLPNGVIIETKGRFVTADRKKHIWIKEQYPNLDIRFVFQNPNARIYKGAKTRYCDWCDKNKFKYAKGMIPEEWFDE